MQSRHASGNPQLQTDERTAAASGAESSRFFAVPLAGITGFAEAAAQARALAILPSRLDLGHYARAGRNSPIGIGRQQLLAPPDVDMMSDRERRAFGGTQLARIVRAVKGTRETARGGPRRPTEWHLGPTNCYFDLPSPRIDSLRGALQRFFRAECLCVSDQFYPPGSFRAWHTDRFAHTGWSWVVFLVQVTQPHRSSFRYMDPQTNELVVVPDRNDTAYFLHLSTEAPFFWHGVLCEDTYRWSQGFMLPGDWHTRFDLGRALASS